MADLNMKGLPAGLVAVGTSADVAVTLSRLRTYEIVNTSDYVVYFSTDGNAVVATDAQAGNKFKLMNSTVAYAKPYVLSGVETLKAKAVGGSAVLSITMIGGE